MKSQEREELIRQVLTHYETLLRKRLSQQEPVTLDEIDQQVEEIGREMDAELERRLLKQQEQPPVPEENQRACPACGSGARYRGTQARLLITRHGEHSLRRRRYWCASCRAGFCPLDLRLGLDRGETSLSVRLWVAALAPHVPLVCASSLLEQLTGGRLCASTIETIAVRVGTSLRQEEHEAAEQHRLGRGLAVERKPARLYVSVDGIFAPLRDPWKRDGSLGALSCRYGECKTAVVYEARAGKQGDQGVRWRAYTATFGDVESFTPLVGTLAHRAGHHFAREVIFLADGQAYNWSLAASQFPTAIQIVDFQHALSHLYGIATSFFGEGAAAGEEWVRARQEELLTDQVAAVCQAMSVLTPRSEEQRKLKAREIGYFTTNAERMRYGTFRRKGYQIATGVMEAACKQVVHQRLDQVGMHWRQETAEAFVALRAAALSSSPPDLRPHCRFST